MIDPDSEILTKDKYKHRQYKTIHLLKNLKLNRDESARSFSSRDSE